jgi:hypothetical protein
VTRARSGRPSNFVTSVAGLPLPRSTASQLAVAGGRRCHCRGDGRPERPSDEFDRRQPPARRYTGLHSLFDQPGSRDLARRLCRQVGRRQRRRQAAGGVPAAAPDGAAAGPGAYTAAVSLTRVYGPATARPGELDQALHRPPSPPSPPPLHLCSVCRAHGPTRHAACCLRRAPYGARRAARGVC